MVGVSVSWAAAIPGLSLVSAGPWRTLSLRHCSASFSGSVPSWGSGSCQVSREKPTALSCLPPFPFALTILARGGGLSVLSFSLFWHYLCGEAHWVALALHSWTVPDKPWFLVLSEVTIEIAARVAYAHLLRSRPSSLGPATAEKVGAAEAEAGW